ncbi:MAG: hypothetical protein F6K10_33840 [Moorea sp. SIO2B7]|nr:hypothetical protein [Moorena sp. SIO2B7]
MSYSVKVESSLRGDGYIEKDIGMASKCLVQLTLKLLSGAAEVEKKIVQRREKLETQEGKEIGVWTMDEHRLGLKPMVDREWFPWWQVPIAPVYWRFEWCWVIGFVEPSSGES